MAMLTRAEADVYFTYNQPIFDVWDGLSDNKKDEYIVKASRVFTGRAFIGKKTDYTQSDPFPRNLENPIDYIEDYMSDLENYDDILYSYTRNDGIVPKRVKYAICEQIIFILITENHIVEDHLLKKFSGTISNGDGTFEKSGNDFLCRGARELIDPFLAHFFNQRYYVFDDDNYAFIPVAPGESSGDTISLTNNTGSTIVAGSPVYISNSNEISLSKADAEATAFVFGLTKENIDDGVTGLVQMANIITMGTTLWDLVTETGSGGLTAGSKYYLSTANAGKITKTVPTSDYLTVIGEAISTTGFKIAIEPPLQF